MKDGKWIKEQTNFTKSVRCSVCGKSALYSVKSEGHPYNPTNTFDFVESNYCPHCGSKMVKEANA